MSTRIKIPILTPCKKMRRQGDYFGCIHFGECDVAPDGDKMQACPQFDSAGPRGKAASVVASQKKTFVIPCDNLGLPTGKTTPCLTCAGKKDVVIRVCSVHKECTESILATGMKCCGTCEDHTGRKAKPSIAPLRTISIGLPTGRDHGHYNCSLIRWQGKLLLASRKGWSNSTIHLSGLTEDYLVEWTRKLDITVPTAPMRGVEDPRLFVLRGELWLSFHGYPLAHAPRTSIVLAKLTKDLSVGQVIVPDYPERAAWEKNHVFFEHDAAMHCVYQTSPGHHVLRFDDSYLAVSDSQYNTTGFVIPSVTLRGGASPVLHKGEWYHWIHTVQNPNGGHTYGLGLYTFAATPPFAVRRRVPFVMMTADGHLPKQPKKSVLFPCGAIVEDGRWRISMGLHDIASQVVEFGEADVERILR